MAARIDIRRRKRKRNKLDYDAEIPFVKRPPPGFHEVTDEDRPADAEQVEFPTTIEELEGKRRADVEGRLRRQDIARNKIAQRRDGAATILQANKLNAPEAVKKRSKLMLPPPQISDHELQEIPKKGYAYASDLVAESQEPMEASDATRTVLANYSQTPPQGMTLLRTPQSDAVMMEAENLARLRESQTPLLGGKNPELYLSDSRVTPRKKETETPNPMTAGGAGLTRESA